MGLLFLILGLALVGIGLVLQRRFRSLREDEARFRPADPPLRGMLAFAGILALLFGLSAMLVGILIMSP